MIFFVALIISGSLAFPRTGFNFLAKYSSEHSNSNNKDFSNVIEKLGLASEQMMRDERPTLEEVELNISNEMKKGISKSDSVNDDQSIIIFNERETVFI